MDEHYGIVYKATNKINGKIYIGQTVKSLDIRISGHITDALSKRDDIYFHKAIRKYGKKNFKWEIIAQCNSREELDRAEIVIIKKYNTFENGYNLNCGGEGNAGFEHTEETKQRMSKAKKGKNNPNYGKHLTEETRRKISITKKGRVCSEETKKKIFETMINNKNMAKKYVIISPEKEKFFVYGLRNFCRNYKREKLNHANLIKVAKGKYNHHKGYKCKYWEEENAL